MKILELFLLQLILIKLLSAYDYNKYFNKTDDQNSYVSPKKCSFDRVFDYISENLFPDDYDEVINEEINFKVNQFNESIAIFRRLKQYAQNVSEKLRPIMQRITPRFTKILLQTELPSDCMASLVRIGQAVQDRHMWALKCIVLGVGYLCPTLTENGRNDVAYRLLLSDTYPSWGYSIKMNATTVWERWDGYTQEKGFQDPSMNSFNHYSLGSVGSWLYQYVAGIDTDSNDVGFKKVIIKPNPNKALTYVKAEYKSIHGLIKSYWNISGEDFLLNVTIAANTRATVDLSMVSSGDVYEIGSGSYQFKIKWQTASN